MKTQKYTAEQIEQYIHESAQIKTYMLELAIEASHILSLEKLKTDKKIGMILASYVAAAKFNEMHPLIIAMHNAREDKPETVKAYNLLDSLYYDNKILVD
jgi:hypothetical protein